MAYFGSLGRLLGLRPGDRALSTSLASGSLPLLKAKGQMGGVHLAVLQGRSVTLSRVRSGLVLVNPARVLIVERCSEPIKGVALQGYPQGG
jgi:hypothetical protein